MLEKYEQIEKWFNEKFIIWYFIIGMILSGIVNIVYFDKSTMGNYVMLSFGIVAILLSMVMLFFNTIILIRELYGIYKEKKSIKWGFYWRRKFMSKLYKVNNNIKKKYNYKDEDFYLVRYQKKFFDILAKNHNKYVELFSAFERGVEKWFEFSENIYSYGD